MNKAKKVWQENKVLFVLAIILIICLIVLISVSLKYFYGTSNSVYGNRLDVTETTQISEDTINGLKDMLEKNAKVEKVEITKKGKIVYISVKFVDDVKMADAKKIVEPTVELFSEAELTVYDLVYTLKSVITKEDKDNKTYTLMGARNANGSGLINWNNYNIEESDK